MKKYFLFLIFILGCSSYTPPQNYKFDNQKNFNHEFDFIWSKTLDFMMLNNLPLQTIDKVSGIIQTSSVLIPSDLRSIISDCGLIGMVKDPTYADYFSITVKINPNKSVFINCVFSNKPLQEYYSNLTCVSKGTLEKYYYDYLDGLNSGKIDAMKVGVE
ncbi:MAG: hypothetical protein A2X61_08785 [Ignavibacteria bacterium GWB2_35_12]|nr:MAG: hypothetical protein A2X61_08785 [Ignavibacteria bacterium GWB2_35_12]OGU91654.1 MAG: hypothetical protein A2220_10435 [Ignavibacteria bacterium RIFOXYA2_FULL_35_10]OGV22624.1 MAG: hypothetical protein A2475_12980 [Ignavibacteria bacterium RIFOXYC2_FULL_35_21]